MSNQRDRRAVAETATRFLIRAHDRAVKNSADCCAASRRFVRLSLSICWLAIWGVTTIAADDSFNDRQVAMREDATLRDVCFATHEVGWAVGDYGTILSTRDGGQKWTVQESPVTCVLRQVGCLNEKTAWVAGGWYDPVTQASRGVLLITKDGGQHWNRYDHNLPQLQAALFTSVNQGVAVGDWSSTYQTSAFETNDGGATWSPLMAFDVGPIADAGLESTGWLLGRDGKLFHWPLAGEARAVLAEQNIRMVDAQGDLALIDSDGGLFVGTTDGKLIRLPAPQHGPLVTQCAAPGDTALLVAGFPGNRLLRWAPQQPTQTVSTGIIGAVHAVRWIDGQHAVAVGSGGAISLSDDGGATWRVVRNAERKAHVLVAVTDVNQVPWAMIANQALQHGSRVVLAVLSSGSNARDQDSTWASEQLLLQQASMQSGAIDVCEVSLGEHDSAAETLQQMIMAWSPAVVCLSSAAQASCGTQLMADIQQQRLSQTPVARLAVLTDKPTGVYQLDPASAMPRCGAFAGDYQRYADGLWMNRHQALRPIYLQSIWDRLDVRRWEHLMSGLPANDGSESRKRPEGTGWNVARLQARTQYPVMIERLLATYPQDPARFAQQLRALFQQLGPEDRIVFADTLLESCERANDFKMWSQAVNLLCDIRELGGLGESLRTRRIQIAGSLEYQQFTKPLEQPTPVMTAGGATTKSPFEAQDQTVNGIAQVSTVSPVSVSPTAGDQIDRWLTQLEPHPWHLFVRGETRDREQSAALKQLATRRSGVWGVRAAEELAVREGAAGDATSLSLSVTNYLPLVNVTDRRPRLDGHLREHLSEAGGTSVRTTETDEPTTIWGYDADFLYVACRSRLTAAAKAATRTRDMELDQNDRLVIELDLDRDLTTAYRFEIDAAGRTRDSCDGFLSWQPRWFVQSVAGETGAVIEVAISRNDLTARPAVAGEAWRVRVQSVPAGQRLPTGPQINPVGWNMIRF